MGCAFGSQNQIVAASSLIQGSLKISNHGKIENRSGKDSKPGIHENVIRRPYSQKTKDDTELLRKAVAEHFIFHKLPKSERNKLVEHFHLYYCDEGAQIFKKGDQASLFFVVRAGDVKITRENIRDHSNVKQIILKAGDSFGDLALLYSSPRSASATALSKCELFGLASESFKKVINQISKNNYEIARAFIFRTPLLSYLSSKEKNLLAYNTLFLRYEKDEVIFRQGDDANCLYVITSGRVHIDISGKNILELRAGDSFGENAFEENQVRLGSASALEKTTILSIGRTPLKKILGKQLQQVSLLKILKWALCRDELFRQAANHQREKIILESEIKLCEDKQEFYSEGDSADSVIVVLQQKVNEEGVGKVFHIQYLFAKNQSDLRITRKLVKNGKGHIAVIKFSLIDRILGETLVQITKNISEATMSQRRHQYLQSLTINDFMVCSFIGEGQISKVYCVVDKFNRVYALKCISKRRIEQKKIYKYVLKERQILKLVECPFVVQLYKTFEDANFLFFITNYIEGVHLCDIIKQTGTFSRKKAQFFISCLLLSLQSMHTKGIIYRDLKPENILVDQQGFLNLVDFGIAKILHQDNGFRTFTVVGTPHYMAPQVLDPEGYSFSADFWSLGIVLYELLCGNLPFGNTTQDPYQIFREIEQKNVEFPQLLIDPISRQLINQLLCKIPAQRFDGDYSKIKQMEFFHQTDWGAISARTIQAPFKIKTNQSIKRIMKPLGKVLEAERAGLRGAVKAGGREPEGRG